MNTYFNEVESEFYRFLTIDEAVSTGTRTNYMSWLRFLSSSYPLASDLSNQDVDDIIQKENVLRLTRDRYTKPTDMANFKSALRKYVAFLNSDYRQQQDDTVLAEIKKVESDSEITETERTAITKARVGQGKFREDLISYWRGCSISRAREFPAQRWPVRDSA